MPKLTINGQEIEVPTGTTILQAAQELGIEIPVFCYHPRLSIAGNCRMCLVQQEGVPKPVASCAMPASEGMVVHTDNDFVKKARKSVLEFLLINHPLDCPVCDQGGECDLQDITMAYGPSASRYQLNKRAVPDKYMGPLIRTYMSRCIHCTRCIRFAREIAGVPELGGIGRGEDMEITSYVDRSITNELSGNLVDICPVGALTSKPYAFHGRPWDLEKTESVDVMDAVGSNIRIDTYAQKVVRILPRLNEAINEEWISDKTRYACDGLSVQRLDRPYVRKNGNFEEVSWNEAFDAIAQKIKGIKGDQIAALAGDQADVESMLLLKELMASLGSPHIDCRQDGAQLDAQNRASYLFNTTIAGIEQADYALIIGTNLRHEAPLVHARLRKRYLQGGFKAAYIGGALPKEAPFTFSCRDDGNSLEILEKILGGRHEIGKELKSAEHPMIIVGMDVWTRKDADAISYLLSQIVEKYSLVKKDWYGFNVLHKAAARVGGLDIGFVPQTKGFETREILKAAQKGDTKVLYLLGADEIDMTLLGNCFVIYQGHHGDRGAHRADVILPGAAYTEKRATYVNTEGRPQQTQRALFAPGEAKEDWKIIRALSEALQKTLPYDSLEEVRERLVKINPVFGAFDDVKVSAWKSFGKEGKIDPTPMPDYAFNFYQTDPVSRASKTMAACAREILGTLKEAAA